MKYLILPNLLILGFYGFSQNLAPQITNLNVDIPWNQGKVIVNFDLSDAENDSSEVKLLISDNGGQTYLVAFGTVSGDVGFPVLNGVGKQIIWNFDTLSNIYNYSLRLVADDRQVANIQDIVNTVDSNLIRSDLEFITGIRHFQTNPAHLAAVKDTIEARFTSSGLQTRRQDFQRAAGVNGQNILGRKQGLGQEDKALIVDAHFDTVNDAPGADDNGSGVVGFLEALRVLKPYNFDKSIRFIGFDFEETYGIAGTYGSLQYVQNGIPAWETIEGVINFEMIGYYSQVPNSQQIPTGFNLLFPTQYAVLQADSFRGNFVTNVGDTESEAFKTAFSTNAQEFVPELKVTSLTLPNNGLIAPDFRRSDHANFWDRNIPALLITDGANFRNHDYHTPADALNDINFTFMTKIIKASVATLASEAGLQNSSFKDIELIPSGVPQPTSDLGIILFPNPAKEKITLKIEPKFGEDLRYSIYDLSGKVVFKETSKTISTIEINVKHLEKGTHFLVCDSKQHRLVKKFQLE